MTDSIHRLHSSVLAIKMRRSPQSRTAKLVREGVPKMAKKLAEEAVEVGLDAVQGDRQKVVRESADLLYHLVVLWAETGILPDEVWAEMDRRERLYGIAEKLLKAGAEPFAPVRAGPRPHRGTQRVRRSGG